tara:strand:- start:622 stop:1482 length:861 start_codon:yes stop_codon:yes gene_type:complete
MSEEEQKHDYLEVDDILPHQQYVCLSFVSPEALIEKREAFNACKFLQSYCKEAKLEYKELYSKYEDFVYKFSSELQRDFDEQNKFQTSMRGIKIRGSYSTKDEATARAKKLQLCDSGFNVFVGEVGKWLPWDPNADGVQDEVFQNTQLNDMMEKYEENNVNRDIFYEEQKRDKIKAAKGEVLKKKREEAEKAAAEKAAAIEDTSIEGVEQNETTEQNETEEPVTEKSEEVVEEVIHEVSSDIKQSLESTDPWLANKLKEKSTEQEPELESEPSDSDLESNDDKIEE